MIALVNHGALLLMPQQQVKLKENQKTFGHFSGLSDEKCNSAMFMEDDYSHENVKAAAERSTIGTFNNFKH